MKRGRVNTSIVLYGKIDPSPNQWLNWYEYAKDLASRLGFPANYIYVKSESFKSGKIMKLNRTEKKLKKVLEAGEELEFLGLDSLPDDYKIAAFDYELSISRNLALEPSHILLTLSNDVFNTINTEEITKELKQFITFESGEIFELDSSETPQIYAIKGKPESLFKGLRVIKEIK